MGTLIPGIVIEQYRAPVETPHRCNLPGAWTRLRRGLRIGAIVKCLKCQSRYEFRKTYTVYDIDKSWVLLDDDGADV